MSDIYFDEIVEAAKAGKAKLAQIWKIRADGREINIGLRIRLIKDGTGGVPVETFVSNAQNAGWSPAQIQEILE